MRQTTGKRKSPGEKIVKDIKRATRKHYSSEEKIRIVLGEFRREVQHPGQICYGSDTQRETVLSCQITRI
jgi:hypothetical protein